MTKDMTEGKPLKLVLRFALPLLVGNLLQQTYNMIDAAIVGRFLGAEALASVGASSSVQFMVLGFCIGICNGFGVPIARDFGAGEYGKMRSCMFHGLLLAAGTAVILTVSCAALCPGILGLLSTPEDIYRDAWIYLMIIFLGIPFTLLYNFFSCILRAVGDSRTPFFFLAISASLNIGLDLFCIVVLKLGCAGAALATVVSQALSGFCCLVFMWKRVPLLRLTREDCRMKGNRLAEMAAMGIPMGLQYSITAIGSMVMQSANNSLGSIYVSGFTAGMKIKQFVLSPFDAMATAVSVFCGQNLGAGNIRRIHQGLGEGIILSLAYGISAGLVLIFGGRTLSLFFMSRDAAAVLDASAKYLFCMGFFFWSLGPLSICRMCTQGLGFPGRAVFSGVAEMIARSIVSFVFVRRFGYTAICFADQTAWLAACLYIIPVCLISVRMVARRIGAEREKVQNGVGFTMEG